MLGIVSISLLQMGAGNLGLKELNLVCRPLSSKNSLTPKTYAGNKEGKGLLGVSGNSLRTVFWSV